MKGDTFVRDEKTGALLNTSMKELAAAQSTRAAKRQQRDLVKRVEFLEQQVAKLTKALEGKLSV